MEFEFERGNWLRREISSSESSSSSRPSDFQNLYSFKLRDSIFGNLPFSEFRGSGRIRSSHWTFIAYFTYQTDHNCHFLCEICFRNVNNLFLNFLYDPWNHLLVKSIQIYRDMLVCHDRIWRQSNQESLSTRLGGLGTCLHREAGKSFLKIAANVVKPIRPNAEEKSHFTSYLSTRAFRFKHSGWIIDFHRNYLLHSGLL